jgi:hypothetical protein
MINNIPRFDTPNRYHLRCRRLSILLAVTIGTIGTIAPLTPHASPSTFRPLFTFTFTPVLTGVFASSRMHLSHSLHTSASIT